MDLKQRREAAQKAREKRAAMPRRSPAYSWPSAAVADLRRLAGQRGGFRPDLERNNACFIADTMLLHAGRDGTSWPLFSTLFGRETSWLS